MNHNTLFAQILAMDAQHIPYKDNDALKARKALVGQLNDLGYTVGVGQGHKLVMRELAKFNCLPPCLPLPERKYG